MSAGIATALGSVMALLVAGASVDGANVDVSRFEALAALQACPWLWGRIEAHAPYVVPRTIVPSVEKARDGWVCIACTSAKQWIDFKAMANVDALDNPRYDTIEKRMAYPEEVTPLIRRFTERHTVAELVELGAEHHVPTTPVANPSDVPSLAPYATRGSYVRNPFGGFLQTRPAFRCAGDPDPIPEAMPAVGSDATREYEDDHPTGVSAARARRAPSPTADPLLPFHGIRVAEFGLFQAGPLLSSALAGFGADVVKIESVNRPDIVRLNGVPSTLERSWERGAVRNASNLGKRGITTDLSDPRGREIMRRLIGTSDILIDNYSPRVLERYGFGPDEILEIRPDIILIRMPAWGLEGPWRNRPGFTQTAESTAGVVDLTGYADGDPLLTGTIIDPISAMTGTTVAAAALWRRHRTGTGAVIKLALCDSATQLTAPEIIEASATGRSRTRDGNRSNRAEGQGTFACADAKWVAVSAETPAQRSDLAAVVGVDGGTTASELDEAVVSYYSSRTVGDAALALRSKGIPSAPVQDGTDLLDHPQLRARQRVFTVAHPVIGDVEHLGSPARYSYAPSASMPRSAPLLGQDNEAVLTELGFSAGEIRAFADDGLIGHVPFAIPVGATDT